MTERTGLATRVRFLLLAIGLALIVGGYVTLRNTPEVRLAHGFSALIGLSLIWTWRAFRPRAVWYDLCLDCLGLAVLAWSSTAPITVLGVYYGAVVCRACYQFRASWLVRPAAYAAAFGTAIALASRHLELQISTGRVLSEFLVLGAVSLLVTVLYKAAFEHDLNRRNDVVLRELATETVEMVDPLEILRRTLPKVGKILGEQHIQEMKYALCWSHRGHCNILVPGREVIENVLSCWHSCADRRTFTARSTQKCERFNLEFLQMLRDDGEMAGVVDLVAFPFRIAADCGGAILIDSAAELSESSVRALRAVALCLRLSIRNAQLFSSLQKSEERRNALLGQIVNAAERERILIASDLHDGPIQSLTATTFDIDFAQAALAAGDLSETAETLAGLRRLLSEEVSHLRSMMVDLVPPTLTERGLAVALRDLVRNAAERDPTIRFEFSGGLGSRPSPLIEHTLYRLAQEAVTNAMKHASASVIEVSLRSTPDGEIELVVVDDGVGFDPDSLEEFVPSGHFGLASMEHRMEMVGGDLKVASGPEVGTRVVARVPIELDSLASRGAVNT